MYRISYLFSRVTIICFALKTCLTSLNAENQDICVGWGHLLDWHIDYYDCYSLFWLAMRNFVCTHHLKSSNLLVQECWNTTSATRKSICVTQTRAWREAAACAKKAVTLAFARRDLVATSASWICPERAAATAEVEAEEEGRHNRIKRAMEGLAFALRRIARAQPISTRHWPVNFALAVSIEDLSSLFRPWGNVIDFTSSSGMRRLQITTSFSFWLLFKLSTREPSGCEKRQLIGHTNWILCLNNSFATRERNGLLLYNGRYNERHDFIALELIDGRLQFSFSLGANLSHVLLEHPHSLADGDWHTVTIDYFNRVSPFEKCYPLGICPTKGGKTKWGNETHFVALEFLFFYRRPSWVWTIAIRPSAWNTVTFWVINAQLKWCITWSRVAPNLPKRVTDSSIWRLRSSWAVCPRPRPNFKFAIETTTDASKTCTSITSSSTWRVLWPTTAPSPVARRKKNSVRPVRAATAANAAKDSAHSSAIVPMA